MSFSQIYSQGKKIVSLEFFPPKSPEQMDGTLQTIQRLSELKPDFMTVTYGAGGGTRELTLQILTFINEQFDIPAVAHLTCVGHSESELTRIVEKLFDNGIRYILALRGDPPHGQG
ncbi:MAG: methylenetetrahydrofolate reductase, partial [Bdellovibrionales bacterium]|nr:methylenetetrahydrofolate reductase [Bdellovibrionales bacterium]